MLVYNLVVPAGSSNPPLMAWRIRRPCVLFCPLMPKFFIKTYGCQMNERDSEQVAHSLIDRGYERARTKRRLMWFCSTPAACATWPSKRRLARWECSGAWRKSGPDVVFGFLGCMAQARGAELLKQMPHVDLVVGTQKFHRVADYVTDAVAQNGLAGVAQ